MKPSPFSWAWILLMTFPLAAQAATERRISVSGKCNRLVTPDRGAIVIGAESRDRDLKVATQNATQSYERAREAVKRLNLEAVDLRTVEYSVGEWREWEKDKSVMKGYQARMGLRVATANINRLGEVIAIAAREGLKDVGQLQTFLSDEKQTQERFACLQDAAQNARAKADRLAKALEAQVGEAVTVTEIEGGTPGLAPAPMMKTLEMAAPQVEAGQQSLHLTVEVTFALK